MDGANARIPENHAVTEGRRNKARRKIINKTLFTLGTLILMIIITFPFVWMILASFKTNVQITDVKQLFKFTPYMGNYGEVFSRYDFFKPIFNSFIIAFGAMALGLIIGLPAAYAIARNKMKKTSLVILVVRFFPAISFLLPWYIIFTRLRISDTHIALIMSHLLINLPFVIWVMIPYFESIPREIDEAARVDGCYTWYLFVKVILPLTGPGTITTSLLSFIFSWNNFMFSMVLAGGKTKTLPLVLYSFMSYASIDWGALMAASVIVTLPILLISLATQKYIIQGLTAGAVKG